MLGTEFARTLRAAQAGDEQSFVRLWRDANPAMIRYLRVVGSDDPYDGACEGWVTVVRGLPGFTGDEVAWRVWLMACTRLRAEEGTLREGWGSVTVLPGVKVTGDGELDIDDLLEPEESLDPAHRGINDTLTALRALPPGEGEVVILRHCANLPVGAVADIVGVDAEAVTLSEAKAFARLGAGEELVAWSLAAPPTPAELADERVVTGAFRNLPHRGRHVASSALDLARNGAGRGGRHREGAPSGRLGRPSSSGSPDSSGSSGSPGRPHVVILGAPSVDPPRSRRGAKAAGRSRTAVLGVVAISASAMSLGGLSAAAYVGALPDAVQQVMHDAIGAPAPGEGPGGANTSTGDPSRGGVTRPVGTVTGPVGPKAAGSPAAAGLCRAWATDKAKGKAKETSVAFRNLATAAGGAAKVDGFCHAALSAPKPVKTASTPSGSATPGVTTTPTPKAPNPKSPTRTPRTTDPVSPTTEQPDSGATSSTKGPGTPRTKTRTTTTDAEASPDVSSTPAPVATSGKGGGGSGGGDKTDTRKSSGSSTTTG